MTLGNFTRSRNCSKASLPPSRSCTEAGVMTNAQSKPSVSTTACRLRPTSFFSPVVAARPALFGRFHRLAVEDRTAGTRPASRLASHAFPQRIMDTLPRAVLLPEAEVMKGNAIRRQIVRQGPPRAAIARDVEDRIEDFAATVLGRTPTGLGLGHPRLDASPLFVREVGRVWHPFHATQFNHSTGIHPRPLF